MYKVWDEQTAEELGRSFGLRVEHFSDLDCGSLRKAIKLLNLAGYSQPRNPPYCWERGKKIAIIGESGRITFRRQPTPREAKIIEHADKEWRERSKEALSRRRFEEVALSIFEYEDNHESQGAYKMRERQATAEEFASEFNLEVSGSSKVRCCSLREANNLLNAFGFWQKTNYRWELGRTLATTYEDGSIFFALRRTPQEARIQRERYEEHVKEWKESRKPKKRNWLW